MPKLCMLGSYACILLHLSLYIFCGYGLYWVKLRMKLGKVERGDCTHSFMNRRDK